MERGKNGGIDRRNVYGMGVVSLVNDAASEMIYPLLPTFLTTVLGAGPAALGLIEGVAETTASLLKYLSGVFSDRTGRRKPIFVLGYLFSNIVRPLIGIAASWWHVLLIRFADRIGKGVRTTPRDALLSDSVPRDRSGWAFGIQRAMDHAGAALGPALAALLLASGLSLQKVFLLSAVPGVIVAITVLFVIRERPLRGNSAAGYVDGLSPRGLPRPFLWFLSAVALFTLGNSTDAFLLLRAQDLGVAVSLLPMLWLAFHVSKTLFSLAGGRLADRYGKRKGIFLGWAVYALVYAGFAAASSAWHAWGLFLAYGLFFGLTEGAERALVADFVGSGQRGRAFGLYHFITGLAALPASVAFGMVWKWRGAPAAFLMGALLAAAAIVPLYLSRVPPERPRPV